VIEPVTSSGSPELSASLQAAWADIAEARWVDAKQAFADALKLEETPAALEGLSWAAWWLDDADTVFASRERAFNLYRASGDPASAARMATWLAADQVDFHGALAVASGWLRRARRLLDPLEPGPDHGWLAFHEGYVALVQGDAGRSSELAVRVADAGRRFDVPDLEMLGLALHGAALVERTEIAAGMGSLDEAATIALASEARIPISRAWACCFLVSACESVRDYTRAFEWCDRIAEFAARYGSRYMFGFCRAHYGTVHVWRGRWHDAQSSLESAIDAYARSRPAFVHEARVELAELRRRQGNWADAERLLEDSRSGPALVCRARLALDRGDAQVAIELAERVLRRIPEDRMLRRAAPLELLVRAHAARGDLTRGYALLEELKHVARIVGTGPFQAAANLAEGMLAASAGHHERARPLLEDAADAFARIGAPFEAAQARLELAASLIALGRNETASREATSCVAAFRALGAAAELRRARGMLDSGDRGADPASDGLTRREREVLSRVAEGLTNRQIAERLFVSEHTIHRHVTNILRKLNLPSRAAAAAYAARSAHPDVRA
jgi:LuxR family transcriptional regulator, maltose regulon positive regulatory protein